MNDHIPDATKMISDSPRMEAALFNAPDAGFANIWKVGCDIERELNAANSIIRQQQLLDEENLRLKDRIKRLEEDLMDAKNKHAALVADVVLYEDRAERIKRLEDIISRAAYAFFRDGSDGQVASGMLTILEEARKP